jgi:N-dimethylarginine dimethylaminohydrolase
MVVLETAILAGLGLLNLCAIVFLAHWIRMHLDQGLQDIDEKLALAITALIDKLMSGNLGEFEAPNPIQGAIAQLIQGMAHQKMNTINATVSERGTDGQFAPAQSFE